MKYFYLSLLIFAGCATAPTSDWRVYDAGAFSFSLPKNMEKTSLSGIDSYVAGFKSKRCYLEFDYGPYGCADTKQMYPNASHFVSFTNAVDDQEGKIASFERDQPDREYHYLISVYFPHRFLKMIVFCKHEEDYPTALRIFRSVKFQPIPSDGIIKF